MSVFGSNDVAVSCSHCKVALNMLNRRVFLLSKLSLVHILAVRWALNTCTTNSSAMLKTFAVFETCTRVMSSCKLQSDPACDGEPQNVMKMT